MYSYVTCKKHLMCTVLSSGFMYMYIVHVHTHKTGPHCLSVAGVKPRRGAEIGGGGV